MALAAGALNSLDKQVLQAMASLWSEPLHPLFQAIAELGGLEVTTLLMIGLAVFLILQGQPASPRASAQRVARRRSEHH